MCFKGKLLRFFSLILEKGEEESRGENTQLFLRAIELIFPIQV